MKYVVIRTTSEREVVVVGKTAFKDEAKTIMQNDFEEWFWQKVSGMRENNVSFEEAYATVYECDECDLCEDSAWLDSCCGVDYNWTIIDSEFDDVLSGPFTMKQMVLITSEEGTYVQGNILLDLNDIISIELEEFLDLISERLVGNPCLMDVNYKPIDALADGRIMFYVSGDVSELLRVEDDMYEELKRAIYDAGVNDMEDFLGHELNFITDDEMLEAMDETFEQMPKEEQLKYYRKYFK